MTSVSSRHSSRTRSRSRSRHPAHSRSRSRTGTPRSPYSSHSFSHSRSRSASRTRSRSRYSESRSRSRSRSPRPGSWSRSRSPSQGVASYSSRSRSRTRSRSRSSYTSGRRHTYTSRSRSRSHPSGHSRSGSNYSTSSVQISSKDPRDRSKRVNWANSIWLVGEKAKDVLFHFCDKCDLPIVIYGRLLPCKHVLCYQCAVKLSNKCSRCQKSVQNIERCLVGGIFMCFESDNCRRTYLSQRDLQAHIDHRHRVGSAGGSTTTPAATGAAQVKTSTTQKTQSKVSPDDSGKQPIPTGSTVPVSLSNDSLSLLQSLQRSSNLAQCTNVSVSSATLGFTTGNKNIGLLPLPSTSTSTSLPHPRIPMNVAPPVRPPPTLTPFPQMMQFSTPPPPLGPRGIPPPSVMNPSIPPPAVPAPRSQPPPFSSTNAVAALAAAAAAMSGTHPKPPAMQGRSNSLLSAPLSVGSTGHLQPTGLNLSLLTNALIGGSTTWSRTNTNISNVRTPSSTSSRLPQSGPSGPMNIGRFPF
ncbi:E3 ubiquitin-protein ligase Hakai [Clonorchis sinensis]|uniref:E3 ubiquitin-protein ligase Hakai n=1 Tax=Clonorchis sinensis TaxID=79923 RepID=A0A419PQT3_CLOSI|nr:E3 ubiquitin-protein ligase Hakai [Clonorchis sinensis]